MRHTDLNLTMSRYAHLYAGQQRETIENLPDFVVQQESAAMTGTYDCVGENQGKIYCPKTAQTSEKFPTKSNTSYDVQPSRNSGFNATNSKETAFLYAKTPPAFSGQKIGETGFEPATSASRTQRSSQAELLPGSRYFTKAAGEFQL